MNFNVFDVNKSIIDNKMYGLALDYDVWGKARRYKIRLLSGRKIKDIIHNLKFHQMFGIAEIDEETGEIGSVKTYRYRSEGYYATKNYDEIFNWCSEDRRRHNSTFYLTSIARLIEYYNDSVISGLKEIDYYINWRLNEIERNVILDNDNAERYGCTRQDIINEMFHDFEVIETIIRENHINAMNAFNDMKERLLRKYNLM